MQGVFPILEYTKGKWENDVHHTTLAIMGIIILIVYSYTVMSYSNPQGTTSFIPVPDFRWWERSVTSGRRVTANFPLSRAGVFQDILLSRIQRCIIRLTLPEQEKCEHIMRNIYICWVLSKRLYRYEARGKYASFSNIAEKWVWGIFWVCFVLICFIFSAALNGLFLTCLDCFTIRIKLSLGQIYALGMLLTSVWNASCESMTLGRTDVSLQYICTRLGFELWINNNVGHVKS